MKNFSKLAVSALALALIAGCGGGGSGTTDNPGGGGETNPGDGGGTGGDGGGGTPTTPSISSCFTVNNTVSYALKDSYSPSVTAPSVTVKRSTVGPTTYNGQAVTGQTFFHSDGTTNRDDWTVTSSGVTFIAHINSDGTEARDLLFSYPQNMSPGQSVTDSASPSRATFMRFEQVSLAGKTFSNVCRFMIYVGLGETTLHVFYAPGYGKIMQYNYAVTFVRSVEYNGDL